MLARLPSAARHSLDIDLYSRRGDLSGSEIALREAAALDLGDHFRFTLDRARQISQEARALRVPTTAYLGATEFAGFHVDLVANLSMTGQPEDVSPLIDVDLGLRQPLYRAYPVVDHIADKVFAMLRDLGGQIASTRYRDLADLALFGSRCHRTCPILPAPTGGPATRASCGTRRPCLTVISTPHCAPLAPCSIRYSLASRFGGGIQRASPGRERSGVAPASSLF